MPMRSWLFVPGDSEKKLAKAALTGADAIVIDLEDSVTISGKAAARGLAHDWLMTNRQRVLAGDEQSRWVRINAFDTQLWRDDLAAVMPAAPHGIMLPKALGPDQLRAVSAEMTQHEQRNGIGNGSTRILPLVSETPAAALSVPAYAGEKLPRLAGMTWGAEDLSAAIGARRKRDDDGQWTDVFRMIRSTVLLAAHAQGVLAIDTLFADFGDAEGTHRAARAAAADGFHGMLAIHPAQVPIINEAFTPTDEELTEARTIVQAFAADPQAGAISIGGRMLDRPHLMLARRTLGMDG